CIEDRCYEAAGESSCDVGFSRGAGLFDFRCQLGWAGIARLLMVAVGGILKPWAGQLGGRPERRGRCPPSANRQRLTVFFPPQPEQMDQTNLEGTARRQARGITSMLSDEGAVYDPEELSLLGNVLDQVMQSLPSNLRTPYNRAAIARNILACA